MLKTLPHHWRRNPWIAFLHLALAMVAVRLVMEFGGGFVDGLIVGFTYRF